MLCINEKKRLSCHDLQRKLKIWAEKCREQAYACPSVSTVKEYPKMKKTTELWNLRERYIVEEEPLKKKIIQ